jgi:hypothetical protein
VSQHFGEVAILKAKPSCVMPNRLSPIGLQNYKPPT